MGIVPRLFRGGHMVRGILWAVLAIAPMALIAVAVDALLDRHVAETIRKEAEVKAVAWADEFFTQLPAIGDIIATGQASRIQSKKIKNSIAVGDIFQFKLFKPDGALAFVSDEARFRGEDGAVVNDKARRVFETGAGAVSVNDGRREANRPDSYVEAYVPAITQDGDRIGVIEVYVDVSALHAVLESSFSRLSYYLIAGTGCIILVPSVFVAWRSRQLRLRDRRVLELQRVDQLTGVLNRDALSRQLDRDLSRHRRGRGTGLLFIDVDRFKEVNDTHGHKQGDLLLRHVARVLQASVREGADVVGRYGGDEFVVLCRSVDRQTLSQIANRIQNSVRQPFRSGGTVLMPSLSMGAYLSADDDDMQSAMHAVDLAVYEAKRRGRDRIVEYHESFEFAFQRRKHIESLVRKALDCELLEVHFQPVFGISTQNIEGFEALLRLADPDGELIEPAEFIPIAEETGHIDRIGSRVLETAIDAAASWPNSLFVSVNVSIAQFRSGALPLAVRKRLIDRNFDPTRLELEVSESILVDGDMSTRQQLQELRKAGISIAIDDFGSGHTSLEHLWRFAVDKIKMDRGFFEAHEHQPETYRTIAQAVVTLGKTLGLKVVAEGVETEQQLTAVTELGVDQAQGFLIGRPAPIELYEKSLRRHSQQLLRTG